MSIALDPLRVKAVLRRQFFVQLRSPHRCGRWSSWPGS